MVIQAGPYFLARHFFKVCDDIRQRCASSREERWVWVLLSSMSGPFVEQVRDDFRGAVPSGLCANEYS